MKIVNGLSEISAGRRGSVITMGNFDGVHRGHVRIIKRTAAEARKNNRKSIVVTFSLHPVNVIQKTQGEIGLITSLNSKRDILRRLDVDVLLVVDFNYRFSRLLPEEFVKKVVYNRLGAKKVVVGEDFRFGRDGKGDVSLLNKLKDSYGYDLISVPMIKLRGERISSTKIRGLIAKGKVDEASFYLGYNYTINGKVVGGSRRGRRMDFPTANIRVEKGIILPNGVFESDVRVGKKHYKGLANIGYRPTFYGKKAKTPEVEVYIMGFKGSLYDREIAVSLLRKIRNEKKFPDREELIKQIKRDVDKVRKNRRIQ